MLVNIIAVLAAYFIGGIPIGLWVGRMKGIPDIRKYGSGNTGATNVLRVVGVKAGIFVWVADCLKGAGPVLLAHYVFGIDNHWWIGLIGFAAVLGHCYSPYLKFTGGRGVSTGLGMAMALSWYCGLFGLVVFFATVAITRYVSLGSVVASLSVPVMLIITHQPLPYVLGALFAVLIIVYRHAANIARLINGTERKIGQKEPPVPMSEDAAKSDEPE